MAGQGIPAIDEDAYGRPTAKTFQSNTIIPNKSTLVEDDDDQTGPEDSADGRSFRSRRDTNHSYRTDGGLVTGGVGVGAFDSQAREFRGKVEKLESMVRERDAEVERLQGSQRPNSVRIRRSESLPQVR